MAGRRGAGPKERSNGSFRGMGRISHPIHLPKAPPQCVRELWRGVQFPERPALDAIQVDEAANNVTGEAGHRKAIIEKFRPKVAAASSKYRFEIK